MAKKKDWKADDRFKGSYDYVGSGYEDERPRRKIREHYTGNKWIDKRSPKTTEYQVFETQNVFKKGEEPSALNYDATPTRKIRTFKTKKEALNFVMNTKPSQRHVFAKEI